MSVVFLLCGLVLADSRDAAAQIPSNGVFYACVRLDRDGDEARLVRLVSADERCGPRETRVQWSATGKPGPQGPVGAPGPVGQRGPAGATGAKGATGATGAAGATGATGATGAAGAAGAAGATGATGATGADGAPGATGERGAQGFNVSMLLVAPGEVPCDKRGGVELTLVDGDGNVVSKEPQYICNGTQGEAGPRGEQGMLGPQGPQGIQGATGETGPSGTAGQGSITVRSSSSASALQISTVSSLCHYPVNFPLTVDVPANADTLITFDGAVATTGGTTITDVFMEIDGTTVMGSNFFAYRRLYATTAAPVTSWSLTRRVSLTAGLHTIAICHRLVGASAGAVVTYSGPSVPEPSTHHLQTVATVTFIKK